MDIVDELKMTTQGQSKLDYRAAFEITKLREQLERNQEIIREQECRIKETKGNKMKLIPSNKTHFGISENGDFAFGDWVKDDTHSSGASPTKFYFKHDKCKFKFCCIDITRGEPKHPFFHWDGNLESPTITPSIGCDNRCGWHGHVTKGETSP